MAVEKQLPLIGLGLGAPLAGAIGPTADHPAAAAVIVIAIGAFLIAERLII